ncbi:MAG TPA: MFS transporter [Rhizomicrobium sp.]|nr:MFS transporter [Rhizomicrobium sp.]
MTAGKTNSWLSPAILAWSAASIFYFYQYMLRSAPAAMLPQLSQAFGLTAAGLSTLIGLFYYGYAPFSLVAGIAMDQLGPRKVTPIAAAAIGCGVLLFATGNLALAALGCFLEGAAAAFAFVAAVYIATTSLPASQAASFIGLTQMLGMMGGIAGVFLAGPTVAAGLSWRMFWLLLGLAGLGLAAVQLAFMPKERHGGNAAAAIPASRMREVITAFRSVFGNPQSILCGVIAGLLFVPTTTFGMVWGVQFLQEGHDLPYSVAVLHSASVSVGWMIGAPLLGLVSDRIGRRKPVIIASAAVLFLCLLAILFGRPGLFPAYSLGLVAGIASGAAMLPYTVIKEANAREYGGTATGVISFINFSLSALLGPIFGTLLARASGGAERELAHYQTAFTPLLCFVALAVILAFCLRETGPAARSAAEPQGAPRPRAGYQENKRLYHPSERRPNA